MADETNVTNDAELDTTNVIDTVDGGDTVVETDAVEEGAADTLKPGGGSAGAGDSKAEKIADLIGLMSQMDNQYLENLKAEMAAVGNETSTMTSGSDGDANRNTIKAKSSDAMGKVVKEDLDKMFAQDENLSEDFRNNAIALFQGAVALRVEAEVAELNEQFETDLAEAKEGLVGQFAERLDTYMAYVADKYIAENKLAIENGLRAELSESFIQGIRTVFQEHYVEIPEDKIDVLEGYEAQIAELEEQVQATTQRNIELTSVVESREKAAAIAELSEGMTDADRERLADILESVDYNDLGDFNKKAALIKENYFGEGTVAEGTETGLVLNEVDESQTLTSTVEEKVVDPRMARYVRAIKSDVKGQ